MERDIFPPLICKQVFRLPFCTGKTTMVSTLHMGLISCRDWFCELLLCKFTYFVRMNRHDKAFCLVKAFPTVRDENPGFLLVNQR